MIRLVEEANWRFRTNSKNMYVIYPPGSSETVTMGSFSNDYRATRNAKSRLRRHGLFEEVDNQRALARQKAGESLSVEQADAELQILRLNEKTAEAEGDAMAKKALMDLVRRCEAVNWPSKAIGMAKAHYLISPPGGKRAITIAVDSTVKDYPENVLAQLTRAGLLDAEERMPATSSDDHRSPSNAQASTEVTPDPAVDEIPADDQLAPAGVGDAPGGYRFIEGVEVAEWDYVTTPLGPKDHKSLELLLENGQFVYACIVGDFIGKSWQSVARHRKEKHPELLSPGAKARHSKKLKEAQQIEAVMNGYHPDALPDMPPPVTPVNGRRNDGPPARAASTAATRAEGNALRGPAQPSPLFQPAPHGTPPPSSSERLAALLGSHNVRDRAATAANTPAFSSPPPMLAPATNALAHSANGGGPAAHQPAPQPATTPPSRPVAPPAAAPVSPAPPLEVRRHETPPLGRVQIAGVAATARPPATATANTIGGTAAVNVPGAGKVPLADMVKRLEALKDGGEIADQLREQNAHLTATVRDLTSKLTSAQSQGQALAEQCIQKDSTIRRLRQQIEQDAATVAAANQLQTLMSTLMAGS
ncbi:MAG: hypothetical protein ABWY93_04695 [Mycobacterium sp.]